MTSSTIRGVNYITREINAVDGTAAARPASINWENFNFPPYLRIIHFDLDELDAVPRLVVRWCYWSFKALVLGVCLNLLTSIVLASLGVPGTGVHVAYSLFNVIIGSGLGVYCLHAGYKGVATSDSPLMRRFVGLQAILALLMFLFSLLPVVNWNGWLRIADVIRAPVVEPWVFWLVMIILESLVWTCGYGIAGSALYHVITYDTSGPMAFSARASQAMNKVTGATKPKSVAAGAVASASIALTKI
mmetsp:Transcript_6848/g.19917  ORF Transcript_6848/g.19917 Transcript_6848/m.19917 type:complete len:246 (-) Transcript_6848:216-953(-)